jgi:hypothetical protein
VGQMIRFRSLGAAIACGAMMMLVGAGVGDAASPPAVTGQVSYVTGSSAQLNGVVEPGGLSTFWAFQYGASATYGHNSAPVGPLIATGHTSVSTLIRGLQPNTTYHFRLIAIQGAAGTSGDASGFTGDDVTFKTSSSTLTKNRSKQAKASLRSHTLVVRHGKVLMPWGCSGSRGTACRGTISLNARGRAARVSCGIGNFRAAAGKHSTVRATIGHSCLTLVNSAPHRRLRGSLTAVFSQGTGSLVTTVTLVG